MDYLQIINLIFNIVFGLYALVMIHMVVYAIAGIFATKRFPKTEKMNRYGIVVSARNEELVIGGLIESILKADYPQDKLEIFIIAHNCTDSTAEVARKYGPHVHVYEYSNPEECTKGYALRYLFTQIEKDFGTQTYDGYFLFDADNIVAPDYFRKMNDAFEYYGHQSVITSYRNSKNFGTNLTSGLSSLYFATGCYIESKGRTACGCSTRVMGTGYVFPSEIIKNGWPYVTLTEDWEFSADQILDGHKIAYCDEASFYDEQPTSFRVMWRQRVRWSRGHLLIFNSRVEDLATALVRRDNPHRMSTYDSLINSLPFGLIMDGIAVLQLIAVLFSPLFGVSYADAFLGAATWDKSFLWQICFSSGYFIGLLRSAILGYIACFAIAIFTYILGRKRIVGVSLGKKILYALVWPFFLLIQFPIDVQALFSHNLGWKTIPHNDVTKIENLQR